MKHLNGIKSENKPGCRDTSQQRAGLILADSRPYDVPVVLAALRIKLHRGETLMHEHGPDELVGPLRGTRAWWDGMGAPPDPVGEGPQTPQKPQKRRRNRKDSAPMRMDLVEKIRKEIAAGTYDTQEKWEAALDRMLDTLHEE
jgi:hypothetical protein